MEQAVATGDRKARACDGLLLRTWAATTAPAEALWLRVGDGRPVSGVPTQYLAWCCAKLAAAGKTALLLVWDTASWHISQKVRTWIAGHNRRVKAGEAAVRIVSCPLPVKSPWLTPIAPKWTHGKQRVVEPAHLLTADERETRVDAALGADHADHLAMPKQVA